MDRLISEQAVIDSIEFYELNPQHFSFVNLINDIKKIPSAEPTKTGHWIKQKYKRVKMYGWYFCDKCRSYIGEPTPYCSECGAKMEVSE